jgi:hypothetical protein
MNERLRKIVDYLLISSPYMHDIGLFHGKMGVVIALYLYSAKYRDELISDYAWDLLQHIYDNINSNMPIGLEYGLAGIGYGTTILYKHGLVDCDLNSILVDVDSKIMEHDPRRIKDMSIRSGVEGLMQYIALRKSTGEPFETFDAQYLTELYTTASPIVSVFQDKSIMSILNAPTFSIEEYTEKPLGIDGGSAYYILKDILT